MFTFIKENLYIVIIHNIPIVLNYSQKIQLGLKNQAENFCFFKTYNVASTICKISATSQSLETYGLFTSTKDMHLYSNENGKDGCSDRAFRSVLTNFRKCSQRSADVIFRKLHNQDFTGKNKNTQINYYNLEFTSIDCGILPPRKINFLFFR